MALTRAGRTAMAGMQVRFIHHVEADGVQCLHELFADVGFHRHGGPPGGTACQPFAGYSRHAANLVPASAASLVPATACAHTLSSNETRFKILRFDPVKAGWRGCAAGLRTRVPMEGLPSGRRTSRAHGSG